MVRAGIKYKYNKHTSLVASLPLLHQSHQINVYIWMSEGCAWTRVLEYFHTTATKMSKWKSTTFIHDLNTLVATGINCAKSSVLLWNAVCAEHSILLIFVWRSQQLAAIFYAICVHHRTPFISFYCLRLSNCFDFLKHNNTYSFYYNGRRRVGVK